MVKKFSAILIALCVFCTMLSAISVSAADTEFTLTYSVDYDSSVISYKVVTPARYRQHITLVLAMGDQTDDVVRVGEVRADNKGYAEGTLQMTGDDLKGTYTLSASGAGYLSDVSYDSVEIYYETYDDVYEAGGTLDRFNDASASDLEALFEEKKDMFIYDFGPGSDYAGNKSKIHNMFVAIREVDYDGAFLGFTDVQDALSAINIIREILLATSDNTVRSLCEDSATLLGIDKEHEDYKGHENDIYKVLRALFEEEAPENIAEIRTYIQQSIAIAKLNRVDAKEATDVIRTYGEVLGIDVDEYESYIKEYNEVQFNYAFVGMNYTTATQVIDAYEKRKLNPPAKPQKPSGGGGGGGGGGGAGGGGGYSSADDDNRVADELVDKPIHSGIGVSGQSANKPQEKAALTDISTDHWAYEPVSVLANAGVINGFEDGTFRPEATVTREQFVKMVVAAFEMTAENANCSYSDVPKNAWYYSSVAIATANNVTQGYGSKFGVGTTITREDAAVMICRIINAQASEISQFSDDSAISSYAKDAVYALASKGVLSGMGDGSFAPKARLTRAQAAKIIYTALKANVAESGVDAE